MKKIKIELLGLISVAVLSFGLNNPVVKHSAVPELNQNITSYMTEPGGGI
ncbi:Phr family secreted Rap phosphatase inhibitor [Bacillus gaemokensis]|nr:Phr family secreted Rap phosphatase inhibitor [Bacillus gaemokensis]